MRHNVNLTEQNDRIYFCFHDVNESFVFLEFCDLRGNDCDDTSRAFCCNSWDRFISRTRVNVDRDSGK